MSIKLDFFVSSFLVTAVLGVAVSYGKLYLFHVAAVLLAVAVSLYWVKGYRFTRPNTLSPIIFYVMFAWYALSMSWAINTIYALKYLFYISCGLSIVVVMLLLVNTMEKQAKIFKVMAVVFSLEIVLSLFEVFTPFRYPISPYSPYASLFGREVALDPSISDEILAYLSAVPTGFRWNSNNLSVAMIILLPFFLFHGNTIVRWVGAISILIIIISGGSKGCFIAYLFALIMWLMFFSLKRTVIGLVVLVPAIGIFMLNVESLQTSENKRVAEMACSFSIVNRYLLELASPSNARGAEPASSFRVENRCLPENTKLPDSIAIRHELVRNGVAALLDSNGLGVGGGGSRALGETLGGVSGRVASMHNFWLEIFVDGGIAFGAAFITWYISIAIRLYLIGKRTEIESVKYYSSATAVAFGGFAVAAVAASSVIYFLPMWIMYGFAIITISNHNRLKNAGRATNADRIAVG